MKPEINASIELSQVLQYLTGLHELTHQETANKEYCTAIENWFGKYIFHPAVLHKKDLRQHRIIE